MLSTLNTVTLLNVRRTDGYLLTQPLQMCEIIHSYGNTFGLLPPILFMLNEGWESSFIHYLSGKVT